MATKITGSLKSDFGQLGVQDGKAIADAIKQGEGVFKDKVLTIAEDIHANAQATADWL
jgi:hypothetical protein